MIKQHGDQNDYQTDYKILCKAIHREVLALYPGTEIASIHYFRSAPNAASCVVRFRGSDTPLWLLHGVSTLRLAGATNAETGEPLVKDVGVEIGIVPFDDKGVLRAMIAASQAEDLWNESCPDCGHMLDMRNVRFPDGAIAGVCPACGYAEQ